MEVRSHLQVPLTLLLCKEFPVPTAQGAGWAPTSKLGHFGEKKNLLSWCPVQHFIIILTTLPWPLFDSPGNEY
jgi:hypothetical protein